MLKGFDGSADGHWPDLGLIMYSPVAEEKARVPKIPPNTNGTEIKPNYSSQLS